MRACFFGLATIVLIVMVAGAACLDPTEVTVEITTDVKCADVRGTTLTVGALGDVERKPATTETKACDPVTARIGSIVLVPSGTSDDTVAVKVVMGLGRDPAECVAPNYGPGCIVARRALRYIDHRRLTIPIFLSAVCNGIGCGETETCVKGDCRPATISDPSACTSPDGCGEDVLGPPLPAPRDAGNDSDAGGVDGGRVDAAGVDAGDGCAPPCLPDPTKVTLSYSAGKDQKLYRFDVTTKLFSTLTSTGCPSAEETAVMSDGALFITSANNADLFRWTPDAGCTPLRTGSSFPYALGTAPAGTVSPAAETLVGYTGADYVQVNRNDGTATVITVNALGTLLPSGDLTAIGKRGFLAARKGTGAGAFACPATGDCIVEVSLKTGTPVTLLKSFAGLDILGLAHSRGELLFYANGQVSSYNLTTQVLTNLAPTPGGAAFSGAAAPPYPVLP